MEFEAKSRSLSLQRGAWSARGLLSSSYNDREQTSQGSGAKPPGFPRIYRLQDCQCEQQKVQQNTCRVVFDATRVSRRALRLLGNRAMVKTSSGVGGKSSDGSPSSPHVLTAAAVGFVHAVDAESTIEMLVLLNGIVENDISIQTRG